MKLKLFLIPFMALILSSCLKDEKPIKLPPPTGSKIITINMWKDYSRNVFLNLYTGDTVGRPMYDWDLRFETFRANTDVWMKAHLNTAKDCRIYPVSNVAFDKITMVEKDSLKNTVEDVAFEITIGQSNPLPAIYLLDRGGKYPDNLRYKKLSITNPSGFLPLIHFANIDGTDSSTISINPTINYTEYEFASLEKVGKVWKFSPGEFQLNFCRYKTMVYALGVNIPYAVTGCLNNYLRNGDRCGIVKDSITPFSKFSLFDAMVLQFSPGIGDIGYNWKGFDFDLSAGSYSIHTNWTYIIYSQKGGIFKLRFLDFYNENKEKGFPKIEFQRLN